MRLGQAVGKLCKTDIYGQSIGSNNWDLLEFRCMLPPDGRFIGRSVAFYDRRTLMTPVPIPPEYPLLRIGSVDSETFMLYASQGNTDHNKPYLVSHTIISLQGYAEVWRLQPVIAASGVTVGNGEVKVLDIPIALERGFTGKSSEVEAAVYTSRVTGFVPKGYAIAFSDYIKFENDIYTIDEIVPELFLQIITMSKK